MKGHSKRKLNYNYNIVFITIFIQFLIFKDSYSTGPEDFDWLKNSSSIDFQQVLNNFKYTIYGKSKKKDDKSSADSLSSAEKLDVESPWLGKMENIKPKLELEKPKLIFDSDPWIKPLHSTTIDPATYHELLTLHEDENTSSEEINSRNTTLKIEINSEAVEKLQSNLGCFEDIKKRLLKTMELVWPSLSEGNKRVILKNKICNDFIREEASEYKGFQFLSQSNIPKKLLHFTKKLLEPFIHLCKNKITSINYLGLLKTTSNDIDLGPILADLFKSEPLPEKVCGSDLKTTLEDHVNKSGYYSPQMNELPLPFDQQSKVSQSLNYMSVRNIISNYYPQIFKEYRLGTVHSKERKKLTHEHSTMQPFDGSVVWRRADSAFDNTPFDELKENNIYVELAPTCTSRDNPICWKKKGLIRIKIPSTFRVARLVEHLSRHKLEKEVQFPGGLCYKYVGKSEEEIPGQTDKETIYDFVVVPWFEKSDFGYYSRELAIFEANKYYGRDFKKGRGLDRIQVGDEVVKRPNHGLTHGVRQGYMALDLIKHLANSGDKYGKLGAWARDLEKNDPQDPQNNTKRDTKREILFLMALHFRAARLTETENYFPEYVAHIKKILKKSQLIDNADEIDKLADLFSEKPKLESPEQKFMMMVLDVAHRADHLRQSFWKIEESEKDQRWAIGSNGEQSEENQKSIIDFMQRRAEIYLEATGAYNVKKYKGIDESKFQSYGGYLFTDAKLFAELENNPKKLYQVMEEKSLL